MNTTIRSILTRRQRVLMLALYSPMIFFLVLGLILSVTRDSLTAFLFIPLGLILFASTTFILYWRGNPCPKCGLNLLGLMYYFPTRTVVPCRFSWDFPRQYRFCPGCGVSLEEECSDNPCS